MNETTFEDAVAQLRDETNSISHETLAFFSDIAKHQLELLKTNWNELTLTRRQEFVGRLKGELETNTLLSFDTLARWLLQDQDAYIRANAIRLLYEYERENIVPDLLSIAQNDPETEPRAEAITALSTFVLQGELEEISAKSMKQIEDVLLALVSSSEKTELRQRALESLGYSSNPAVARVIKEAWLRDIPMWKASALFAMGRSNDDNWCDDVLQSILHENEIVRLAAVKAAGELELDDARPLLLKLLEEEQDEEVFNALIWSLSQIGGEDVREYFLSLLDQYEEDEEAQIDYIEEALENLDFTEDMQDFDFLSFDADDPLDD